MAMVSDPIADMLARLRNGGLAEHEKVDVPASRLKVRIAEILREEGFIKNFRVIEDNKQGVLRLYLKYGPGQERAIAGLRRVSKPGRRLYVPAGRVPSVLGGMGVAILSTPRGVLTDRDSRKAKVGGEVLCYVW
jgi:small subunit ribosomal protein S8